MTDHSGFGGKGHDPKKMYQINTQQEKEGEGYDPEEWVWKWNSAKNPDGDTPIYIKYDDDTMKKIEQAFMKFRGGDNSAMLLEINGKYAVNVSHAV